MIEFLCPEGHKIRCQDDQAGKTAKCPRCGVEFRIPDSQATPQFPVSDSVTDLPPIIGDSELTDGTTLTPDHFAESRSHEGHGLFAAREADGTYTLSAVAWNSIARVVVRQVRQLPGWMSD